MNTSIEKMWESYCKKNPEFEGETYVHWHFCNTQELALKLANLVKLGRKKATSSLYEAYKIEEEEFPKIGQHTVITDIDGQALCIIRTKKVEVLKYKDFPAEYAAMEGEGDLSLDYWREVHQEFFEGEVEEYKLGEFHENLEIVYEEFECVYGGVMSNTELVREFWARFDQKDYRGTEELLAEEVEVRWVTSREKFDREKFIKVNEDFPGEWRTIPLKVEELDQDRILTLTHVYTKDSDIACYATSIFTIKEGKIVDLEEYWADIVEQPEWRKGYSEVY